MTDNEIVKGLECCNNGWCDNRCPYYGREEIADCREQSGADQLDLINRQQAKIEQLQELCGNADGYADALEEYTKEKAVNEFAELLVSKAKSAKERFLLESLVESVMKEIYG